tara:strand:- start:1628 stop:2380 length:753 start_codon:yes stop_codon:yes gene_type:complete
MISVIQVYNTVRDIANKDQKGFITPEMFNSLLPAVQSNIFTKIYDYAVQSQALKRSGADLGGEDSVYLKAKNYLSEYVHTQTLAETNGSSLYDEGKIFFKPENCNRIISLFDDRNVSIDLIYNTEKMSRIINSNLSEPTDDFPVALISDQIELFPDSLSGNIYANYYRNPTSRMEVDTRQRRRGDIDFSRQPFYSAQSLAGGISVPNTATCRGFDLPYEFYGEVVSEICKMIGVSLRDTFLTQYGAAPQV